MNTSECPTIYLVPACTDISIPNLKGLKYKGVAHVLSTIVKRFLFEQMETNLLISIISKVSEPGDSKKTALVFLVILFSSESKSFGLKNNVSIPIFARNFSAICFVGP